ncbi:MAG: RidA family protein [Pseudomonadaceae bacterium]|nr:RidA family protein [Pseudomonadaceae bacterium]
MSDSTPSSAADSSSSPSGRLRALGLRLPAPTPMGNLPFKLVRVHRDRAYLSGHVPIAHNGTLARPRGKVGAALNEDEGYQAARRAALSMLSSLQAALGSIDNVECWLRVFGMVNAAPGFTNLSAVVNGASDLIVEVYGEERGAHARSAVGMAELPFGVAVEVEAEVVIRT